ncbi:GILT-like protein 1 [Teleopsis dalmanni]|uniref:GILT-like protein 1 n=1 Tax=Teleopsis dalmanni TaxID=139649 RepID=UPI0018CFB6FA|nr:GILT-like protein 1 [Teleopsis dalmanni]
MSHKYFCLVLVCIAAAASAVKVPVTIYYESLCPDSAKFINEQVYPAMKTELKDHLDITLVPFGKSQYSTQGPDVLFTCHHGPNECYGNKVHACAIELIQANSYQTEFTRESLTLDFVNCMMKVGKNFPDNVYPGARCARENHISTWENIQQCANSTDGSALLKKQGDATNNFQNPLVSVPTVVFKQQYDAKVSERAQSAFLQTGCKYVPQPQPKICAAPNAANSISYMSILSIGLFLLLSRFL